MCVWQESALACDEAALARGAAIYAQKPNLRRHGVTWSQADYADSGLQAQYVRFKSIQRFTETFAALQHAARAGVWRWLWARDSHDAAELRVASLGGGPGFELLAAREFFRGGDAAAARVRTASLDLEASWRALAEALGHRFCEWDVHDGASLRRLAFGDADSSIDCWPHALFFIQAGGDHGDAKMLSFMMASASSANR